MRKPKLWISLLILTAIGLHALPVLSYQGSRQTRWPILTWAMYAKSRPPGPVEILKRRIVAVTSAGQEMELTPHLVGVSRPALGGSYIRPLWNGDTATAQELFMRVNRDRSDPIIELRIEAQMYTLAGTGLVRKTLPAITYRPAESLPR